MAPKASLGRIESILREELSAPNKLNGVGYMESYGVHWNVCCLTGQIDPQWFHILPHTAQYTAYLQKWALCEGFIFVFDEIANKDQLLQATLSNYIYFNILPVNATQHLKMEIQNGGLVMYPTKKTLQRLIYIALNFWIQKEKEVGVPFGLIRFADIVCLDKWMYDDYPELGDGQDTLFKAEIEHKWKDDSIERTHIKPVFEYHFFAMEKVNFQQERLVNGEAEYTSFAANVTTARDVNGQALHTPEGFPIDTLPATWKNGKIPTLHLGPHPALVCLTSDAAIKKRKDEMRKVHLWRGDELDELQSLADYFLRLLELDQASQFRSMDSLEDKFGPAFRLPSMPNEVHKSRRIFPVDPRDRLRAQSTQSGLPVPEVATLSNQSSQAMLNDKVAEKKEEEDISMEDDDPDREWQKLVDKHETLVDKYCGLDSNTLVDIGKQLCSQLEEISKKRDDFIAAKWVELGAPGALRWMRQHNGNDEWTIDHDDLSLRLYLLEDELVDRKEEGGYKMIHLFDKSVAEGEPADRVKTRVKLLVNQFSPFRYD